MSKVENLGRSVAMTGVMLVAAVAIAGCDDQEGSIQDDVNVGETGLAEQGEAETVPLACQHEGITLEDGRIAGWNFSARNFDDPYQDPFLNCQDALQGRDCAGTRHRAHEILNEGGLLGVIECDADGNPRYKHLTSPFALMVHDLGGYDGCGDVVAQAVDRMRVMSSRVVCDPETGDPVEELGALGASGGWHK